jgi:hypothetical protein
MVTCSVPMAVSSACDTASMVIVAGADGTLPERCSCPTVSMVPKVASPPGALLEHTKFTAVFVVSSYRGDK